MRDVLTGWALSALIKPLLSPPVICKVSQYYVGKLDYERADIIETFYADGPDGRCLFMVGFTMRGCIAKRSYRMIDFRVSNITLIDIYRDNPTHSIPPVIFVPMIWTGFAVLRRIKELDNEIPHLVETSCAYGVR